MPAPDAKSGAELPRRPGIPVPRAPHFPLSHRRELAVAVGVNLVDQGINPIWFEEPVGRGAIRIRPHVDHPDAVVGVTDNYGIGGADIDPLQVLLTRVIPDEGRQTVTHNCPVFDFRGCRTTCASPGMRATDPDYDNVSRSI